MCYATRMSTLKGDGLTGDELDRISPVNDSLAPAHDTRSTMSSCPTKGKHSLSGRSRVLFSLAFYSVNSNLTPLSFLLCCCCHTLKPPFLLNGGYLSEEPGIIHHGPSKKRLNLWNRLQHTTSCYQTKLYSGQTGQGREHCLL